MRLSLIHIWLRSFDDPQMFRVAHLAYGFGPAAKLTGDVVEDERVWGCTEWGFGNVGAILTSDIPEGIPGASHSDGICLNCSVWLDGVQVQMCIRDRRSVWIPSSVCRH